MHQRRYGNQRSIECISGVFCNCIKKKKKRITEEKIKEEKRSSSKIRYKVRRTDFYRNFRNLTVFQEKMGLTTIDRENKIKKEKNYYLLIKQ